MTPRLLSFSLLIVLLLFAACGEEETIDAGSGTSTVSGDSNDEDGGGDDGGDDGSADSLPDGPLGAGPYPVATLDITVTHPDIEDVVYTISCLGDTATVVGEVAVSDQEACLALNDDAVRTRLMEGPPADQVCTEQYGGPDTARIVGRIDDIPVDATVDRVNGCGISDWDSLLVAVLPSAIGVTE